MLIRHVCRILAAPQIHCNENSQQIFPEMKLRGLDPNFYIHVSVSDLYIPTDEITRGPPELVQHFLL